MANKDYVRRGQGNRKGTRRKTTPTKKPWKAGLVAALLLSGFGYGLYILSNDPEPPEAPVVQSHPKSTPSKETLPPPPTEEWEYVNSLPNKKIEVEAKDQVQSEIPYIMQCGAFKLLSQAEQRKAMIAFEGIPSKIRKTEGSSWFRVVLGPYKLKRDAEREKHKLQRAKIEPCAIWKETQ